MQLQQSLCSEWWDWLTPDFPTATTPLEASARHTGDVRYFGSELTATLRPSSVLTARFFHQSIPYRFNGLGPNLNADTESLQDAGRLDTFTGVSRSNYTAGPSPGVSTDPGRRDCETASLRVRQPCRSQHPAWRADRP